MSNIANHSDFILKLNLQYFAEDEDMILPDDFEMPTDEIVETETQEIETEPGEETKPPEEVETPVTEQPKIKVKYNHEEQELSLDEAVPLVQKGMNYDKMTERLQALESDPRLAFVEQIANQYGMTVNEYMEAVQQQSEQQRIQELVEQGISQELAQEMLENRKFREQFEADRKAKQEEEQSNAQFNEFFQYFRDQNGRDFVPNQDEIPKSVWDATQNGVPLKYAYMEHEANQLRAQLKVLKQTKQNEQKAPVQGVSAHGSQEIASEDDFMKGFNSI